MRSFFLNSQLLIYSPLFLLFAGIFDGKAPVPDVKDRFTMKKYAPLSKECQDCRALLVAWNEELKTEEDLVIDEDEVDVYWQCLEKLAPALNHQNLYDYYFLLDCLTNLMDYYDYVDHDEEMLDEIEEVIYMISAD